MPRLKFITIFLILVCFMVAIMFSAKANIQVGDKAPDFTLVNQVGKSVSLRDFKNKQIVVVYFYPKDETSICTKEACSFRDSYKDFQELNCEVIGISSDSVESHQHFAQNHNLPFVLLSDPDSLVRNLFSVPKTAMILPGRVTYVIDKNGIIKFIFNSQIDGEKHMREALKIVKELQSKL